MRLDRIVLVVVCVAFGFAILQYAGAWPASAYLLFVVMAWTSPRTWSDGEVVTGALLNTHLKDNLTELRAGGLAIASQAANDFLFASSASQLGRLAASTGRVPRYTGSAWAMVDYYPVGSIYINASVSTNPATLLGFGTWTAFGAGRVMVGLDAGQTEFDTAEETGGAKTHTLQVSEVPGLTVNLGVDEAGSTAISASKTSNPNATITTSGGGGAHSNLQPYITCYFWKRVA